MSPRFLLDTNTVSEPIRLRPNRRVVERIRVHEHEIAIAAPTWHELVFGYRRLPPSRRRRTIERYLADVAGVEMPILPYDSAAADWHATERARLEGAGRPAPFVDAQIAAIAVTNGLASVTANLKDFQSFAGLVIEDWRS